MCLNYLIDLKQPVVLQSIEDGVGDSKRDLFFSN